MVEQRKELTEYEKRLKRAERFGIDPSTVVPPQQQIEQPIQQDETMFTDMKMGNQSKKIEELQADIDRIKQRQQRFEKGVVVVGEENAEESTEP